MRTATGLACSTRSVVALHPVWVLSVGGLCLQVDDATLFLQGKSQKVLTRLIARMEAAARRWNMKQPPCSVIRSTP